MIEWGFTVIIAPGGIQKKVVRADYVETTRTQVVFCNYPFDEDDEPVVIAVFKRNCVLTLPSPVQRSII